MLGIVLVIALVALSLAVYVIRGQRDFLRESFLIGFVLWGTGVLAATEILSLFQAIGFWEILVFWTVLVFVCLWTIYKHWDNLSVKKIFSPVGGASVGGSVKAWPFIEKVSFNRIVFFSFCLGVIALVSPPNTYDAMTYHMSRVMHWIQNHSLTYYPTHIPRELYMPSFPEYIILHFQLLSNGDYWANFVQWLAMCGSLLGVSLITKELGAGKRGQILSALIAITIPMGIMQSSSTQTDYVETLWVSIFIYFFLRWRKTFSFEHAVLMGMSLGLAVSTKGVAFIVAGPFLLWMIVESLQRFKFKKVMMVVLVGCLTAFFYAGTFYRNAVFFHGKANGAISADADSLINARYCWEGFWANTLRNVGLHVITPSWVVNTAIKEGIYNCASFFHIDLNNKDWSYYGSKFPAIDFRGNESYLGSPLHFLLFGVVFMMFVLFPKLRNRDTVIYLIACLLGWIAFNLILKWQPWHARFHLPMFVIMAPLAGFVMEKVRTKWIVSGTMGVLFLSAWVIVIINVAKPIFSSISIFYPEDRDFLHFMMTDSPQSVYLEYKAIARVLHNMGCKNIGLIMGSDENEYLLWDVLNPSASPKIRIESILVNNASSALKYPLGDFTPDAIIAINDDRSWINWASNDYQVVWHSPGDGKKVSVLMKSM